MFLLQDAVYTCRDIGVMYALLLRYIGDSYIHRLGLGPFYVYCTQFADDGTHSVVIITLLADNIDKISQSNFARHPSHSLVE